MTGWILWIVLVSGGGSRSSQQAVLLPTYKACEAAKVQMVNAITKVMGRDVVAECLPRSMSPATDPADPMGK